MSGCRSGAMLGGPSVCDAPVLEGDEAAEVGVTPGRWCRRHGEVLDSAAATIRRGGPVKAKPIKPANARVAYDERRRAESRQRVAERAEAVAAFIEAAASHPVTKREVVAAVGGGHTTDRAISRLVESGRIRSRSGGGASGYYPSGSH